MPDGAGSAGELEEGDLDDIFDVLYVSQTAAGGGIDEAPILIDEEAEGLGILRGGVSAGVPAGRSWMIPG